MKIKRFLMLIVIIAGIIGLVGCAMQTSSGSGSNSTQQSANTGANFASTTLVLEAENAAISGGSVASSISGYSGTGYVAMSGTAGSYVEFTFTANSANSASVKFYYTSSVTATYDITINGGSSVSKSFSSNSSWTSSSKSFSLPAGTVTLRITADATTSSGMCLDRIEVTGDVAGGTSSSTSSVASSSSSSKSSSSSSVASSSSSSKSSSSSSVTSSSSSSVASSSSSSSGSVTRLTLETIPSLPSTTVSTDNASDTNAIDPTSSTYGAKGDGTTNDTAAIQAALNAAGNAGTASAPAIVVLKNHSTFLSGPLSIPSNTYLKIESPTVLLALPMASYGTLKNYITNSGTTNLGVIGNGTINGNGGGPSEDTSSSTYWWGKYSGSASSRPRLVYFTSATNVLVKDITLKDSPSMHLEPRDCTNVIFSNITITAPSSSPNTDGIDPSNSNTVYIDHCTIADGDDNIAIKSNPGEPVCQNIYITNCTFGTGHGLSIGSQTNAGVQHVLASNCTFNGGDNGIRIKSPRTEGGLVTDIQYSNMTMSNIAKYPFEISGYYPESTIPSSGSDSGQTFVSGQTPQFQNILIQDVTINNCKNNGGYIVGLPECIFTNIQLIHFVFSSSKPITIRNATVFTSSDSSGSTSFSPACVIQENASLTAF